MAATQAEITKAYRDLALRYHPDRHKDNELEELAAEKLVALNEAYEVLGNPNKRAAYDAQKTVKAGQPSHRRNRRQVDITRSFKKSLLLLGLLGGGFLALRFIRNPKAILVIMVVLAVIWYGPKLLRIFKRKSK